jgi:alginate O-acetyltransferase complex protein AlgI
MVEATIGGAGPAVIFTTKAFLIFLPAVLVIYHALAGRAWKYRFLLGASWGFYALCSPRYLWVILLLTAVDYAVAKRIEDAADPRRKKRWLVLSIVSNLGLLATFKYAPFAYDNAVTLARVFGADVPDRAWSLLLPLGISFHTFQGISYTVDVYRGQVKAVRGFTDYALFVAFFPQLAAGPIVRAVEFLPQMAAPPKVTADQISDGVHLVVTGLMKKLFIADWLDQLVVSPVFGDPAAFAPAAHRWAALAWTIQIYCDFSGYSDIACGLAKWFGFELPNNFRLPYLATNIADFWRRWHVSFSTWLRDYLYFPLGGSRCGPARANANLLVVFVLCGLWHGATWNWIAYGGLQGLAMMAHRTFDRAVRGNGWADTVRATAAWHVLGWAATMAVHLAGLVIVRMPSWEIGLAILGSFVPGGSSAGVLGGLSPFVPVLIGLGMVGHVAALVPKPKFVWGDNATTVVNGFGYALLIALLICFGPGVGQSFIYIQF